LSLALKSLSPDQPPGWNDPYRNLEILDRSPKRYIVIQVVTFPKGRKGGAMSDSALRVQLSFLISRAELLL